MLTIIPLYSRQGILISYLATAKVIKTQKFNFFLTMPSGEMI